MFSAGPALRWRGVGRPSPLPSGDLWRLCVVCRPGSCGASVSSAVRGAVAPLCRLPPDSGAGGVSSWISGPSPCDRAAGRATVTAGALRVLIVHVSCVVWKKYSVHTSHRCRLLNRTPNIHMHFNENIRRQDADQPGPRGKGGGASTALPFPGTCARCDLQISAALNE